MWVCGYGLASGDPCKTHTHGRGFVGQPLGFRLGFVPMGPALWVCYTLTQARANPRSLSQRNYISDYQVMELQFFKLLAKLLPKMRDRNSRGIRAKYQEDKAT